MLNVWKIVILDWLLPCNSVSLWKYTVGSVLQRGERQKDELNSIRAKNERSHQTHFPLGSRPYLHTFFTFSVDSDLWSLVLLLLLAV